MPFNHQNVAQNKASSLLSGHYVFFQSMLKKTIRGRQHSKNTTNFKIFYANTWIGHHK